MSERMLRQMSFPNGERESREWVMTLVVAGPGRNTGASSFARRAPLSAPLSLLTHGALTVACDESVSKGRPSVRLFLRARHVRNGHRVERAKSTEGEEAAVSLSGHVVSGAILGPPRVLRRLFVYKQPAAGLRCHTQPRAPSTDTRSFPQAPPFPST